MPKEKSVLWKFFQKGVHKNDKVSYKCNYCSELYVKNATRQRRHLEEKCLKCPQTVKTMLKKERINNQRQLSSDDDKDNINDADALTCNKSTPISSSKSDTTDNDVPSSKEKKKKSNLFEFKKYIDSMMPDEEERLGEKLARAIFSSDCALSVLENEYWLDFFREIRPSWKIPSTYKIATSLLNSELNRIELKINEEISKSSAIGLQCDGWSDIRNSSIVNFVVTTPETMLYKSKDTKGESHTGEYIAGIILEVIEEIGPKKVLIIVTDGAANMVKAREIVHRVHPHISIYGCSAHCLNLVVKGIIHLKTFKGVQNSATAIVKDINASHLIKASFIAIQKERGQKVISLKLPGKTRWGSTLFCAESLLFNKMALKRLAISDNVPLKHQVKTDILSENFWCGLLSLHEILAPVVKWITILEADSCTVSSVPKAWNEIMTSYETLLEGSPLSVEESAALKLIIKKRGELSMQPIHFAANILDPKFNGAHLTREQKILGTELIHDHANYKYGDTEDGTDDVGDALMDLAKYRQKEGSFSLPFVQKTIKTLSAITWWKTNDGNPKLSAIAAHILSMPATSAVTERSFSRYGNVHTPKRNRLTTERAGKITFISFNLKLEASKKRLLRGKQK